MVVGLNRTGAAFRNARAVKACTPSNMIIAGSIATFSCFQVMFLSATRRELADHACGAAGTRMACKPSCGSTWLFFFCRENLRSLFED